jgi:hypothetical protein
MFSKYMSTNRYKTGASCGIIMKRDEGDRVGALVPKVDRRREIERRCARLLLRRPESEREAS